MRYTWAAAAILLGCSGFMKTVDKIDPSPCPPDHPYCMCRDEKRHLDCSYDPVNPTTIFGPGGKRDGGTDGDASTDASTEAPGD